MKALKLLLFFIILNTVPDLTFGQARTVTGQVTDTTNAPLADATVSVVGRPVSTKTRADGTFTISVPAGANQLRITYIGYEDQTVPVTSGNLTISMTTATSSLTDVVVVGYGTARRRDVTGAVASVRERDFNRGVLTSPDQLIQGKAAGVLVLNNTGQPGGSTTVRIRGTSSIRSGNQPLFVVDGVPLSGGTARPGGRGGAFGNDPGNPLAFINPNDIASMEILKDASATAIFGSRGANGVVLITTKRGRSGTAQIDASSSVSASSLMKKLEVLNASEYRQVLKDYGQTTGDFGADVDAFDEITRTAITQNHNVAVGGGTETGRYRLSVGYLDQQGIIENSDFKKITASLTTNFKFLESRRLGLDINILTTQTNENVAPISAFVGFTGNLISQALQWNPTQPLRNADGTPVNLGGTTINPVGQLEYFSDKTNVNTIIASISPSFKLTNELEYRFLYSANRQVGTRRGQINRLLNVENVLDRGVAFIGNNEQTNQQLTNTLNYNRQITPAVNLNAVIGHEWLIFDNRGNSLQGSDFPNLGLNYYDILQYSTQNSRGFNSFASPSTELQSFFGRAIANIKDRYLFTGTIRSDGSTRFGANNKYGYFPSVAFGWNISNEDFLKGNNFVRNLKLRASWGKTGNQEFPSGASLSRLIIEGPNAIRQVNVGNADLKWETSTTTNVGIDFSILNNKLTGSVDYFYKKTTDVLFEQTIIQPAPPGVRYWLNLPGHVLNKGVEVMLTGGLMRTTDINWNVMANASFLQNTVEGLSGFYETGLLRGQGFSGVRGQRLINGQPLNVWYLRRFEGIDKSTGQSIYSDGGNTLYYSGSPNPKVLLGFSTDFSYKKFSAIVNMNGARGHYIFNNTAASVLGIGNLPTRNIAKALIGTGVKENISNAPAPSTRNLEKANFLKLTNATLSYRIGNIGQNIRNVNVSLTGQNLFVITKYTGFDPEVNTEAGVGGIPSFGVEYIPYPSARTFVLGINLSL